MLTKMDDGLLNKEDKSNKMGASSNINSARIVVLQEKKKTLEETLAKHKSELRQLCIKEAELTGEMPSEFPLEPGETPPTFRRRIGTSFQLTQSLVNNINDEEESIQNLELEMQVLAKMAEAALGLANEHNVNKTVRRKHMAEYQHLKQKFNALEEKLQFFKTRMLMAQQPKQPSPNINQVPKQKKKPRPLEIDDTVSMNDQFFKTPLRHSLRSLQHPPMQSENVEHRYSVHTKLTYRNSDSTSLNENMQYHNNRTPTQDDPLLHSYLRLSINGYKNYVDRQGSPVPSESQNMYLHSQSNVNLYNKQQPMHYPYSSPSQTLPHPHALRRSPQPLPQTHHHQQTQSMQDFTKYNANASPQVINNTTLHRQASPSTSSNSSVKYYPAPAHSTSQMAYQQRPNSEHTFRTLNPHQLQPHQQYEQDVMTSGLGGYWKRAENGDMFWCNSASDQNTLPKDKRFGSLDRRKNKRVQKRISPNVDPKSTTPASVRSYNNDPSRTLPSKAQQVANRHRQNNRQLVRTQSLGSVGGQTVDSVWPSDDNSSCGSESYSEHNKHLRTRKQKEWYETSLDGPPIPETPCVSRAHSTAPSIAPEEKYMDYPSPISPPAPHTPIQMQSPPLLHSPYTPKPMLEIPAESNPSPRVQETNLEIYNNNIPRNGTVVQPAQIKPYYEESKPFEMSDFYKYSTKYKKSPIKSPPDEITRSRTQSIGFRNLHSPQSAVNLSNDNYEDDNASVSLKSTYQPLQQLKCKPFSPTATTPSTGNRNMNIVSPSSSLNTSLELNSPNVAENFSAEMNAWYQNHENQTDNNNATLV